MDRHRAPRRRRDPVRDRAQRSGARRLRDRRDRGARAGRLVPLRPLRRRRGVAARPRPDGRADGRLLRVRRREGDADEGPAARAGAGGDRRP